MKISLLGRVFQQEGFPPLGQAGDSRAERVEFLLAPRYGETDLTGADFFLRWKTPSGREGSAALEKTGTETEIRLCWNPEGEACAEPGVLRVQLAAQGPEGLLWQSMPSGFTLAEGLGGGLSPAITVRGRELVVPEALRELAAQGDEGSRKVPIRIPRWWEGRDLSGCTLTLRTLSSGGRDDVLLEKKECTGNEITALWEPAPPQTSFPGRLQLQLRAEAEGFLWQSGQAAVCLIPALEGEPAVPAEPPLWEQQLAAMNRALARAEEIAGRLDTDAAEAARFAREQGERAQEAAQGLAADRAGLLPELTALTMAAAVSGSLRPPEAGHVAVTIIEGPDSVRLESGRAEAGRLWI